MNSGALGAFHRYRACVLTRLGQHEEAAASVKKVAARQHLSVKTYAEMHLCRGDADSARAAFIAATSTDSQRADVIKWMQPRAAPLDFGRLLAARDAALRADKLLINEVGGYGRILDWPIEANAPAEQD